MLLTTQMDKQDMADRGLDAVVIYADREHYGSFKFYTGADPRFEEALLFIYREGEVFCALGNECLNLTGTMKIPVTGVLCQCLSLPNQPMEQFVSVEHTAKQCGLKSGMRVGLVDWKLMYARHGENFRAMSGMPEYLVDGLAAAAGGRERLVNVTDMMVAAPDGLRCCIEAAAAAEFEFGAASASESVLRMLEYVRPGMSEREIVSVIQTWGQPVSCHPYVVGGANTRRGLISPSDYRVELGDELVVSVGLEGGLTCRHVALARLDIIPADPKYCTPNVEDGLLIADEALRTQLREQYPQVYQRIMARRAFAEVQLGLKLKPEVLPLSNCFGCYNPYVLQRGMAIAVR